LADDTLFQGRHQQKERIREHKPRTSPSEGACSWYPQRAGIHQPDRFSTFNPISIGAVVDEEQTKDARGVGWDTIVQKKLLGQKNPPGKRRLNPRGNKRRLEKIRFLCYLVRRTQKHVVLFLARTLQTSRKIINTFLRFFKKTFLAFIYVVTT